MVETISDQMVEAYLERIGLEAPPEASIEGLEALLMAHRLSIPFENLDIRLGRPVRIDIASVFDKLVTARRGGYCFENNRLFSDMLARFGFPNRQLLARVRLMLPEDVTASRTHVLQLVDLNGEQWIADAGFGGSFVPPMRLKDGETSTSPDGASHRLRNLGDPGRLRGQWLLERAGVSGTTMTAAASEDEWQPQYTFDLDEVAAEDLEMGNHWTSTREGTLFTVVHFVSIIRPTGFASLMNGKLAVHGDGETEHAEIFDPAEYREKLAGIFGIALSDEEVARLPLFDNSLAEVGA